MTKALCLLGALALLALTSSTAFTAEAAKDGGDPETSGAKLSGFCFKGEGNRTSLSLQNDTPFTPYLGAALGLPEGIPETPDPADIRLLEEETNLRAYQLQAGVDCDLGKGTNLNLGYRFSTDTLPQLGAPLQERSDPGTEEYNFSLGLKVAF